MALPALNTIIAALANFKAAVGSDSDEELWPLYELGQLLQELYPSLNLEGVSPAEYRDTVNRAPRFTSVSTFQTTTGYEPVFRVVTDQKNAFLWLYSDPSGLFEVDDRGDGSGNLSFIADAAPSLSNPPLNPTLLMDLYTVEVAATFDGLTYTQSIRVEVRQSDAADGLVFTQQPGVLTFVEEDHGMVIGTGLKFNQVPGVLTVAEEDHLILTADVYDTTTEQIIALGGAAGVTITVSPGEPDDVYVRWDATPASSARARIPNTGQAVTLNAPSTATNVHLIARSGTVLAAVLLESVVPNPTLYHDIDNSVESTVGFGVETTIPLGPHNGLFLIGSFDGGPTNVDFQITGVEQTEEDALGETLTTHISVPTVNEVGVTGV